MNKTLTLWLSIATLVQASWAQADVKFGDYDFSLTPEVGLQLTNGAENQSAKFGEYADYGNTVLAGFKISGAKDDYFIDASASRIGLRDQSYKLIGGDYNRFNYKLSYNSIFHNFSVNDKIMFDGVGTTNLTLSSGVTSTNPDSWTTGFGYNFTKKQYGGEATYKVADPLTVTVGFNQVKEDGLRPASTMARPSGQGNLELPEPVNYTTNNVMANAVYRGDDWFTDASFSLSAFSNANPTLTYADDFYATGKTGMVYFAPNNHYAKYSIHALKRNLPLSSTLSMQASYATITDSFGADIAANDATSAGNGAGKVAGTAPLNPDGTPATGFNGNIAYGNANLYWAANPVQAVETNVHYNFTRKWNTSSEFTYAQGNDGASYGPISNELFWYYKHNPGVSAKVRLPANTFFTAGYDYYSEHRGRVDSPSFMDNIYSMQLRNNYFDFLSGWLRYQYQARTAELGNPEVTSTSATGIPYHPFDGVAKTASRATLGLDGQPIEDLDIGFEFDYKGVDYGASNPPAFLGRTGENYLSSYVDLSYRLPKQIRFAAFFGQERAQIDQNGKAATGMAQIGAFEHDVDMNYFYGINLNIPIQEKVWDLALGWEQTRNDGSATFDVINPISTSTGPLLDIPNFDDSFMTKVKVKTKYQFTPALSASVGYTYQNLTGSTYAYDGYFYAKASTFAFTGAYADRYYNAHMGYLTAQYSF